jgi:hypothetical protein
MNHTHTLLPSLQGQTGSQRQQHLPECSMHSGTASAAMLSWQREQQTQVLQCRQPLQPRYGAAQPGQELSKFGRCTLSSLLGIPPERQCGVHLAHHFHNEHMCRLQRPKRGAAAATAAASAARPATAGAHHDRHPHAVPPADHHAERRAAEQPATASSPAPAPRPTRSRRTRRNSSSSDSDVSPPRRPAAAAPAASLDPSGGHEGTPPPGVQASIFSPAFSLHGGKSAAELPDGGVREATPSQPAPPAAAATATRQKRATAAAGAAAAAVATVTAGGGRRPPVCSPPRPGARSKLEVAELPASDDENANSEHDTQIRLSSGPGAQADPLVSLLFPLCSTLFYFFTGSNVQVYIIRTEVVPRDISEVVYPQCSPFAAG